MRSLWIGRFFLSAALYEDPDEILDYVEHYAE